MTNGDEVRFGILLRTRRVRGESDAEVFARTLALAQRAEALGMDDLWVTEHHFHPTIVSPSALALASFLLGRTRRVQVGTAVTLLPLHSPVHVAEQAALLDQLSGGRFVLGVGRGAPSADYEAIGRGIDHWHDGLPESLDLLRASWCGEVEAASRLHQFRGVTPAPVPRTRSGPPLYVAAGSPGTIEHAAHRGLPLLMYFDKSAGAKADMVAMHAKFATAVGRPGTGYAHAGAFYAHVTDSPGRARELMLRQARALLGGADRTRLLIETPEPAGPPPDENHVQAVADRLVASQPVGDVETCVRHLLRDLRATGCTRVLLQVELDSDQCDVHGTLHRLTAEVVPLVRAGLRGAAGQGSGDSAA
ncbi:LLM class flavin-dependent oxidoreductase [Streptomyces iconiensis]|uniref:LLM class flavin-dependent oxidoreductase n=1 Tax=Streptomyces iconiensis TaxID=1384038 RepID=A0ABT7A0L0_9ACTN|nr:LLM class flavin-dependent oxidoreductase [Streptomyces iconiensis]MDJ1134872.1 LLM class flavin-dependent oxidoreductase [Streptomyces iconiensis]